MTIPVLPRRSPLAGGSTLALSVPQSTNRPQRR
jgi:hypothetical protein